MKSGGKTLAYVLSALALGNGAQALVSDSSGGPYHGIVERNVFDIKPPPPPVDPASIRPPAPPPPNIRLNGITDILGRKQVLMKVQLPAKPPAPAKEEAYVLTEGQREGEIEVLEIDTKAGTVKVNDYGTITNLSLELNSEKLVNAPPPAAMPPGPGGPPPPGAFVPPSLPTLPAGRTPRTLRLPGSAGAQSNPELNSEQQSLMIEAQRMKHQQDNNPIYKIFPPTPLTPQIQAEQGNEQSQTPQLPPIPQ